LAGSNPLYKYSTPQDSDNDGTPDVIDNDDDDDGTLDSYDKFPLDPSEWADADGDGYGDNSDVFPSDPTEWADADGDGIGDNSDSDTPTITEGLILQLYAGGKPITLNYKIKNTENDILKSSFVVGTTQIDSATLGGIGFYYIEVIDMGGFTQTRPIEIKEGEVVKETYNFAIIHVSATSGGKPYTARYDLYKDEEKRYSGSTSSNPELYLYNATWTIKVFDSLDDPYQHVFQSFEINMGDNVSYNADFALLQISPGYSGASITFIKTLTGETIHKETIGMTGNFTCAAQNYTIKILDQVSQAGTFKIRLQEGEIEALNSNFASLEIFSGYSGYIDAKIEIKRYIENASLKIDTIDNEYVTYKIIEGNYNVLIFDQMGNSRFHGNISLSGGQLTKVYEDKIGKISIQTKRVGTLWETSYKIIKNSTGQYKDGNTGQLGQVYYFFFEDPDYKVRLYDDANQVVEYSVSIINGQETSTTKNFGVISLLISSGGKDASYTYNIDLLDGTSTHTGKTPESGLEFIKLLPGTYPAYLSDEIDQLLSENATVTDGSNNSVEFSLNELTIEAKTSADVPVNLNFTIKNLDSGYQKGQDGNLETGPDGQIEFSLIDGAYKIIMYPAEGEPKEQTIIISNGEAKLVTFVW